MFVVDASAVLPHPPAAVARVVSRLHLLPRWCGGLQRARPGAPGPEPAGAVAFLYTALDVRLVLRAHTLAGRASGAPPGPMCHAAHGDGLSLAWTLTADAEPPGAQAPVQTRLHIRITAAVDPGHPLATTRSALYRAIARRVPGDLQRLGVLLDRRARAGRAAAAPAGLPAGAATRLLGGGAAPVRREVAAGPATPRPAVPPAVPWSFRTTSPPPSPRWSAASVRSPKSVSS
jgi:hypothetical protein